MVRRCTLTKREARRWALEGAAKLLRHANPGTDAGLFDGLSDADVRKIEDALADLADQLEMRAHRMRGKEDERG